MFSVSVFQAVSCNMIRESCEDFCGLCIEKNETELNRKYQNAL